CRHTDRERLGVAGDVLAGEHPDDAVEGHRRRQVVAANLRVGDRRAHDRRVTGVGDRGGIVDVGAAAGQEPRVLDTLDRLADPAFLGHHPASRNGTFAFLATTRSWSIKSSGIGTPCSSRSFLFARSGSPATSTGWLASTRLALCSTSITWSRSSSNLPSTRNALGSSAMKKWPMLCGSDFFCVWLRIGENDAPAKVPARMCTMTASP